MALQHPKGPYARFLEQADEVFTAEGDRVPRREIPPVRCPPRSPTRSSTTS